MAGPFRDIRVSKRLIVSPHLSNRGGNDTETDGIVSACQEAEKDCGKCVERGNKSIMVVNSRDAEAPNCPRKWKLHSPVGKAVQNHDIASVKRFANEDPRSLSKSDNYGRTPFHYACWYGSVDIVLFLSNVLSSTDCFATDNQGWSALHFACDASLPHTKVVQHLLCILNVNPRQETKKGSTPASLAAYKGHFHIVRILTDLMRILRPTDPKDQRPSLVIPEKGRYDSLEASDHPNGDRNMSRLENRLFTFTMGTTTWPRVRPTERQLAEQGFVYTGLEERVFCFCCKAVVDFWDNDEDPLLKHYQKSPKCQFLRNNFSFEVDRLLAQSKIQHACPEYANNSSRLHSYRTWKFSDIVSYFKLASAGFFYTGVDMRTQCFSCGLLYDHWRKRDIPIEIHQRWNPSCEFLSSIPPPVMPLQKVPSPHLSIKQPDYENVENRIKSFKLLSKEVPVSSEDCAKAGLFFLRKPDVMQCFKCDAIVRGWIIGDIPSEKHRAISPQCKFLREYLPTKLDHYSVDPSSLPEPEFTREDLEQMSSLHVSLQQPHYHPPTRSTSIMPSPQENESSSYASRRTLSQPRARTKHVTLPSTQSASLVIQSTSALPDRQKQPVSGKVCLFHFDTILCIHKHTHTAFSTHNT